jgi:SPX domain protein involved in polyphosphate accumulation
MKFAKYLENNSISKWKAEYIKYKALKKLLKALPPAAPAATDASGGAGTPAAGGVASTHDAAQVLVVSRRFIAELQKEVARINAFVLMRQEALLQERHAIEEARAALPSMAESGGGVGGGAAAASSIEARKQLMQREREVRAWLSACCARGGLHACGLE